MGLVGLFIFAMWLGATDQGAAHAHLQSSVPIQDTIVDDAPTEIVLTFTEPVEAHFSTFKVYALEPQEDMLKTKAAASQLVSEVLTVRNDQGAEARVDEGILPARGTADKVTIELEDELAAGAYVVMWRVLSVDTHHTQGFYVFTYDPKSP